MASTLPQRARDLLDGTDLVVLTTLNADGTPHTTPVWAMRDGDQIIMSTVTKRAKHRNLLRDPRASVMILDRDDPVCYFSVNGTVDVQPDEHSRVLHELSTKYLGAAYPAEPARNVRVTLRLTPQHVIAQYEPAR